jgi:hypothetical protein
MTDELKGHDTMTKQARKFPQIKIRPTGDRFAVRWIHGIGKPAHRAIVPTLEIANAIREAVKAGGDGWRALASATSPAAAGDGQADAIRAMSDAVTSGLVSWADIEREVLRLRLARQERIDRVLERVAGGQTVQAVDPAVAVLRAAKGGAARAANMTPERRAEISRKAANSRWRAVAAANEVRPALPPAEVTDDAPEEAQGGADGV